MGRFPSSVLEEEPLFSSSTLYALKFECEVRFKLCFCSFYYAGLYFLGDP